MDLAYDIAPGSSRNTFITLTMQNMKIKGKRTEHYAL